MPRRLALLALVVAIAAGTARAQCVANVPHVEGQWHTLPYLMPINPISATLLHDGRILIVSGSENDASNNAPGAESYRNAIWDPTGTTQASIAVQNIEYDVFCSGTAILPDGRPLVVGGTSDYSFTGEARSSIFDPATSAFLQTQKMVDGRWYATATALGDGRVMAFSGLGLGGGTNNTVEIYDVRNVGAGWTSPATAPFSPPLYPRMELLPSGRVFFTGNGGGGRTASSWLFDPIARTWSASAATTMDRTYGSAVILPLLPPAYAARVMNFGGGNPATASTEIIDFSAGSPTWKAGPSMSSGRIQMNATILPNGKVVASGGSVNNESPSPAGKHADVYDPVANTFASGGTASYSRLYHSVTILLPDATIASMGSNPGSRGRYEPAIEIYTPPYLFDANDQLITAARPAITDVTPGPLGYGAAFAVAYTSTSPISSAVLVRPGSATHASDMDQRLVGLCGASPQPACTGNGTLSLTTPPNGSIAPPGWYMLFLLDSAGVPSVARFVQLSPYATAPPQGTIDSPATDVTITAGQGVAFGTSTAAASYGWVFPGGSPATSTAQTPGTVTFATPGEYTVSLTVADASGNSDPSPPTREITVLPATPDFDLDVAPSSGVVFPGQSTTFVVTVVPKSGFTGSVGLSVGSESGFPTGITSGGFSPASVVGAGSSILTMKTTTGAPPYALSLTVKGTSGTLAHTAAATLLVDLPAPASLTATPGNALVALSWPASVGASGYHVKRARVPGGPYVTVGCASSTTYTDTSVANGTTYYYAVSAYFTAGTNAGGESADSAEAAATPQVTIPPAPGGVTATAGNAQVALKWNAASGAGSYRVKRATTSGGPYTTVASPFATSYTDTGLANGTTYYYVVSAVNTAGESPNSAQVTARPTAVPAPPSNLVASGSNGFSRGTITLRWTQSPTSGVTQNRIYRRTSGGTYPSTPTVTIAAGTSYRNTGLGSRVTYCYVVTAVSASGESARSNESCATTR